ncbi:MAG: hypothetical protein KME55_03050 [Nostoc indistinguendum CM1-VF10]|nr:hypothetical protein [Nostoc indistinguendum CM1-VF10]
MLLQWTTPRLSNGYGGKLRLLPLSPDFPTSATHHQPRYTVKSLGICSKSQMSAVIRQLRVGCKISKPQTFQNQRKTTGFQ